jgi:hypothetical protein
MCAYEHLRDFGGQAPGSDGRYYDDLPLRGSPLWKYFREFRDELRSGTHQPCPDRTLKIGKGGSRGTRTISIPSVDDRIAQRAVLETLQPLIDPYFGDNIFGRPGTERCRLHAMALAEHYAVTERRTVWLTQDIRDAFGSVPLPRLLDLVRKYSMSDEMADLVKCLLSGAARAGLRQGGPLSPFLLNLYLHHLLDREWRRRHPDLIMIRYVDDLLVLCRSKKEARRANDELATLLKPMGMTLREDRSEAIRDLSKEHPADWLGFGIYRRGRELRYRVGERAWDQLEDSFRLSLESDKPDRAAHEAVRSWLNEMGPAGPAPGRRKPFGFAAALDRIQGLAASGGIKRAFKRDELTQIWAMAAERWRSTRTRVRQRLDQCA